MFCQLSASSYLSEALRSLFPPFLLLKTCLPLLTRAQSLVQLQANSQEPHSSFCLSGLRSSHSESLGRLLEMGLLLPHSDTDAKLRLGEDKQCGKDTQERAVGWALLGWSPGILKMTAGSSCRAWSGHQEWGGGDRTLAWRAPTVHHASGWASSVVSNSQRPYVILTAHRRNLRQREAHSLV